MTVDTFRPIFSHASGRADAAGDVTRSSERGRSSFVLSRSVQIAVRALVGHPPPFTYFLFPFTFFFSPPNGDRATRGAIFRGSNARDSFPFVAGVSAALNHALKNK